MFIDGEASAAAHLVLKPAVGQSKVKMQQATQLRRSPRKQATRCPSPTAISRDILDVIVTSKQRCSRPATLTTTRTARQRERPRKPAPTLLLAESTDDGLDELLSRAAKLTLQEDSESKPSSGGIPITSRATRLGARSTGQKSRRAPASARGSRQDSSQSIATAVRTKQSIYSRNAATAYIAREAHCDDLNEPSGTEGEDQDTDLSGFVVDDNAEISFNDVQSISSDGESDGMERVRLRRTKKEQKKSGQKVEVMQPRRRLVRGRRKQQSDSELEDDELLNALDNMTLGKEKHQGRSRKKSVEIVDLTSSPAPDVKVVENATESGHDRQKAAPLIPFHSQISAGIAVASTRLDVLSLGSSDTLQLGAGIHAIPRLLPSKSSSTTGFSMSSLIAATEQSLTLEIQSNEEPIQRPRTPTTPLATPPASPSKLKSPSKLLSPSKRNLFFPKASHRQSTDAFWDHEVINNHNDTYSPRKALLISPRKQLNVFGVWQEDVVQSRRDEIGDIADAVVDNDPAIDESEFDDDLPSPCASPTKSARRAQPTAAAKDRAARAEQKRLANEKKTKAALKKKFDTEKDQMARDLIAALDRYVCDGKIADLTASTGGVKIVWSKTLRQTAGRANWQRIVRKNPTTSPVKNFDVGRVDALKGCETRHTASIELAEKIVDRPERLVNTLSHEFCHLANFMISHVKDQPHGASFQQWGRRVTSWLSSAAVQDIQGYMPEWSDCEVTTKHSYVVEMKYLWLCTGRPAPAKQTLIEKMMGVSLDETADDGSRGMGPEGCGAEYGRHSKSIDTDRQRCGRCKGFLKQIRPTPRAPSPRKGLPSPRKGVVGQSPVKGTQLLEKMLVAVQDSA